MKLWKKISLLTAVVLFIAMGIFGGGMLYETWKYNLNQTVSSYQQQMKVNSYVIAQEINNNPLSRFSEVTRKSFLNYTVQKYGGTDYILLKNGQEVVNLTPKKRTLFGTLFASMLRSFWTALTAPGQKAEVLDAEFVPAQEDHTETVQNEERTEFSASDQSVPEVEEKQEDVVDEELNRIVGLFKLSREQGYTLKLIPGTPEENAPVFDFENERILRPAA